jgi:hypothetical protein
MQSNLEQVDTENTVKVLLVRKVAACEISFRHTFSGRSIDYSVENIPSS